LHNGILDYMSKGRGNFTLGGHDDVVPEIIPVTAEVLTSYPSGDLRSNVKKQRKVPKLPKISLVKVARLWERGQPSLDSRSRNRKKTIFISVSSLVLLLVGAVMLNSFLHTKSKKDTVKTPNGGNPIAKADFKPFVSKDTTSLDPNNVRYDDTKKLVSINDTYKSIKIVLSQQKLPDDQAKDPSILLKVTGNLRDAQPIQTDKGSAFLSIDTTKKTGQTAVFLNKNLLVFARTDSMTLTKEDWQKYINSLAVAN
jgi:hypothetical protein